ncbi:MAG: KEOPS complex subunit Pcc1 [Thermoplasmatota archaeon]
MKVNCVISIRYDDAEIAHKILQSLSVDDVDFVKSQIKNNTLEATITATSVSSLLHTIDDYLSCLSLAEKIVYAK